MNMSVVLGGVHICPCLPKPWSTHIASLRPTSSPSYPAVVTDNDKLQWRHNDLLTDAELSDFRGYTRLADDNRRIPITVAGSK